MTEPASTAVGGIALYKLGAFGGFAFLAAILVMVMTLPKSPREFVVAMICTVVSSVCGGAFLVRWLDIGSWVQDDIGMIALCGVIFVCGLPAWVIVRAWFAWSESRKDKALPEMVKEFREGTGL
ncbi:MULTISPECIES: hypothetical protein [unclassified Pseudomonas]|uniref:hypothetical protein n=1 Tax=unclassified Pseudomonas TaxID=196821 RepID=UPI000730B200|nr:MULTISPECIES: hypothetical protein [unclassified Pseudomonas]KSW28447.1 hypothetical protein AOX63_00140 [Pseudomonas sp. ADP]OBP10044.1 hypothetical protein BAE52_16210 [Pseudomonas sp. EGD-AKN5]QOF85708.1 hypothetical protein IG194_03110 [Pseudomonas sp. ADPe]